MRLIDFVKPELILPDIRATEKFAVLEELATHVARHGGVSDGKSASSTIDAATLTKILSDRERLASTAIGEGVAIPHGKLASVHRLVGCVARSRAGVDFDSIDGGATHIFFTLVAPENSSGIHLKALARISRLFKDPAFRGRIMQAKDAAEIYRALAEEDAKY